MRKCRYKPCRKPFYPEKDFYYYCCWEHRVADVGEHYEKRSYDRQGRDQSYDRGFWDGARARPSNQLDMPVGVWKGLLLFSHPDKWQGEPGLLTLANEVTRWLLDHRPSHAERN